jgi:hypothetical protein
MSPFRSLDQAELSGKRVLVRLDLNVPMENGRVGRPDDGLSVVSNVCSIIGAGSNGSRLCVLHRGYLGRGPVRNCSRSAPFRCARIRLRDGQRRKDIVRCHGLDGNLLDRLEAGRALRTVPKMTDVRAGAVFRLVGGDQFFVAANAVYSKRGMAIGAWRYDDWVCGSVGTVCAAPHRQ